MKPVLPVLREKKRYLAFEIISNEKIPYITASKAIKDAFLNYAGLDGYANAGFLFLKETYNLEKNSGVIKVSTKEIERVKSSLIFVNKVNGKEALIRTKTCSGIIKKTKNKR